MARTKVHGVVVRVLCLAALLACPRGARAGDVSFMLQPGMGLPISSTRSPGGLDLGSGASFKALLGLGSYADFEVGVGFVGLPMSSVELASLSGLASTYGAGVRLRRPHGQRSFHGASPWVEVEALRVEAVHRGGTGLAVGMGLAFPVGSGRALWLGPFVRYLDVELPDAASLGAVRTLFAGVTVEIVVKR
jgi:hypothetical protein